jgi:hypothetical protein
MNDPDNPWTAASKAITRKTNVITTANEMLAVRLHVSNYMLPSLYRPWLSARLGSSFWRLTVHCVISGNIVHKTSWDVTELTMKSRIFLGTEVLPSPGWKSELTWREYGNSAFLRMVNKFLPDSPMSYSRVRTFVKVPLSRKRNKIVARKIHTFLKWNVTLTKHTSKAWCYFEAACTDYIFSS